MHRLYRKNNQKVVSWMLVLIMCLSFGLMPAFAESANAEDANAEGSILEE